MNLTMVIMTLVMTIPHSFPAAVRLKKPHLVIVPPRVVLQHNQTEVEVNCSVLSDSHVALEWIMMVSSSLEQAAQDNNRTLVLEVSGPVQLNECIFANVTSVFCEGKRSRLNLLLQVTSQLCIDKIQNGSLYLRGVCMASNARGVTSETFVLGVIASSSSQIIQETTPQMQLSNRKWTGSPEQVERHRKDLIWLTGLIVGLTIPVVIGVFIVFNLSCMRSPVAAAGQANMFGAGNMEL